MSVGVVSDILFRCILVSLACVLVACPNVLTGVHTDLMLLVLKSHAYDLVSDLTFLRSNTHSILSLAPASWPIEILDYLQFWFYLGNHHAARKEFEKAQDAYNMVLTAPSQDAVSAVQVEAYKKLILVSLLAQGEVRTHKQSHVR